MRPNRYQKRSSPVRSAVNNNCRRDSAGESKNSIPARLNAGDGSLRYRLQHLLGVTRNADLRPDGRNGSIRSNHERRSLVGTKGVAQRRVRVGKQGKWKIVLRFKFLMRSNRVSTHTHDLRVVLHKFSRCIAKLRRFVRSTRRIVFGIKPQHRGFSAPIGRVDRISPIVRDRQLGDLIAYC